MIRTFALAALLLAPACAQPDSKDDDDTSDDDDNEEDEGPTEASATLIVDGVTYEFTHGNFTAETCDSDLFGIFFAVMYSEDVEDSFLLELPGPENTDETPLLEVTIAGVGDYVADETGSWPAVTAGDSQVSQFTVDGYTATGSALAINDDEAFGSDPIDPVDVEFTVTCDK